MKITNDPYNTNRAEFAFRPSTEEKLPEPSFIAKLDEDSVTISVDAIEEASSTTQTEENRNTEFPNGGSGSPTMPGDDTGS